MNIPKKVKVGGKTYHVEITDRLSMGTVYFSGECVYGDLKIRIIPQAEQKMQADFLHELLHAVYAHLGYTDHYEKHIEELAEALYMVIQDNPKVFALKEREGK